MIIRGALHAIITPLNGEHKQLQQIVTVGMVQEVVVQLSWSPILLRGNARNAFLSLLICEAACLLLSPARPNKSPLLLVTYIQRLGDRFTICEFYALKHFNQSDRDQSLSNPISPIYRHTHTQHFKYRSLLINCFAQSTE